MSNSPSNEGVSIEPVVSFRNLALKYGKTLALDHVTLDIPARKLIGMIGPDGVGKSTLLSLVTGAHAMQEGNLRVIGGDMRVCRSRRLAGAGELGGARLRTGSG